MRNRNVLIALVLIPATLLAQDTKWKHKPTSAAEEFRVKREAVFEFSKKPELTNDGDTCTIAFETKGFCDVTVAIEDAEGKILRHLVSGVLGPKAPAPLQKNSKAQKLLWDGKNDQGDYLKEDVKRGCSVRVSLGLKPQFERTLFWSPKKKAGTLALHASPDGVYIGESGGIDHVRLYDHKGNYVKAVYPFPAHQIDHINSLKMHTFIQDGKRKPLKRGYLQSTLLTVNGDPYGSPTGITAIAANKSQVALAGFHLNRLAADGSSGGASLYGPPIALPQTGKKKNEMLAPRSIALSPDGKWLYLAGYVGSYNDQSWGSRTWGSMVMRMAYNGNEPPTLFAGDLQQGKTGNATGQFRMPTSVACDLKGRVYVSDFMNDRIQIFDADGKHLKSLSTPKPALVKIHQKTGDIYVFSLMLLEVGFHRTSQKGEIEASMSHLGPYENPVLKNKCPLPLTGYAKGTHYNGLGGLQHVIELDSWAEKPTIWIINNDPKQADTPAGHAQLFEETKNKLVLKRSFTDEAKKAVKRLKPPVLWRQRLIVNPVTGKLYVAEGDSGVMKSVNQLVELDPASGAIKFVDLPLGSEDLCFDVDGRVYLRTGKYVVRYSWKEGIWREIPWDYGEEVNNHGWGMGARAASFISGLSTPGHRSHAFWQLGGMDVSLKGHLAVTTCNGANPGIRMPSTGTQNIKLAGRAYTPKVYPGRMRWGEIHIWDKHGKLIREDAVPGMGHLNGIGIDQDDNIYALAASRRMFNGKQFDPALGYDPSGTVIKFLAGKTKVLSSSTSIPVPLGESQRPKRSIDIAGMTTGWVEGAEWFYGGIGFSTPSGCICWNSRFSKDYFNRSIAPESLNYSVAIIDSSGNLILRMGKYGNVDDGKPLVAAGGPKGARSMGGDEVSLFYACYVASHTDKRIFIADAGNARILSVKLGYHTDEKIRIRP